MRRSEYVLLGNSGDLMPVCPRCGDLNAPLARACETCGSYLLADDAHRDLLVNLSYARPVDNSVDSSLLDPRPRPGVHSSPDGDRA